MNDGPLIVQSDKTLLLEIDHPLAADARKAIAPFAELERSPEHMHTYRLTPLGLWNARAAGFDAERIASYGESDVTRLLGDAGIVRHRGKIESTINNARRYLELREAEGSLLEYVQRFRTDTPTRTPEGPGIPPLTPESTAMSKDLKRRGWSFVGPTTVYAFMQAMGLVNDHLVGCHRHAPCAALARGPA